MAFSGAGYSAGLAAQSQLDTAAQVMAMRRQAMQRQQQADAAAQQNQHYIGQYYNTAYPVHGAPPQVPGGAQPMPVTPPQALRMGPVQQTPNPGQASVPMRVPGTGVNPAPQAMPTPYQTVASAGTPPPFPQPSQTPGMPQPQTMETVVNNLRRSGIPQDRWMSIIGEVAKHADADFQNQYRMLEMKDRAHREQLQEEMMGLRGREIDARIARANQPKSSSSGSINQFAGQMAKVLEPIEQGQIAGQKILSALATGSPVAPAQIRAVLSDYLQKTRMTNLQYNQNKAFGNVYERGVQAINKWVNGTLDDQQANDIRTFITQMNSGLFAPARAHVIKSFQARAKAQGISQDVVDSMGDVYGVGSPDAVSAQAAPAGMPAGSKRIGKTPDGKPVWQSPDGKKWVP